MSEALAREVMASRKYAHLSGDFVARICREEYPKYPKNQQRVKAVRRRLHTASQMFMGEAAYKNARALLGDAMPLGDKARAILALHASTAERLEHMEAFYAFALNAVPAPGTVLDLGCGLHPLALPFMGIAPARYYACDVDLRAVELVNAFFALAGMGQNAFAADVVASTPAHSADIAFALKLLPALEAQAKGRGFALLGEVNARYLVVSYPLKTLGGRERGMDTYYERAFLQGLGRGITLAQVGRVHNELVFVLKKGGGA